MNVFIYSRKSVYTGKGESIGNQIEMCKQYIFNKLPGVQECDISIYEDEGFSGKNIDRPQFQRMLRDIKCKKPEFVVCYRLDRISRNVSDFSSLIEELNDRNISFVCIKEEFDTSKPMGKAMMYIASVFAQLERETIAERVRDNMLMLARTGRWLGGTTPTGYTSEKLQEIVLDGKIKTSCRLREHPGQLCAVDTIFEKFLELRSVSGVSKYLIKQGIKSRGGAFYSLPGIKEILQNPVYCIADREAFDYFTKHHSDVCFEETECPSKFGILAYNKRDYKKKHAPRQPMNQWIIAIGKHKGRIPGIKWVAVQNIIEDNIPTGKKPAKMHNDYSLLSGLIYCERCKSRMFAKQRGRKGASPDLFDYICNSKLRGGVELCGCQNIGGQQADDMVCEYLINHTSESEGIYSLLEKLRHDLQRKATEDPIVAMNERIKKCSGEMDNLVNTLSREKLGEAFVSHVNAKISELDREVLTLIEKREELQKNVDSASDQKEQIAVMAGKLSSFKNSFNTLSIHEKRAFIKLLVRKIVWDGGNLHVFMRGG